MPRHLRRGAGGGAVACAGDRAGNRAGPFDLTRWGPIIDAQPASERRTSPPSPASTWVLLALIALTVTPTLVTAFRLAPGWVPAGDTAIIVLRADDVAGADTPLVGMPTTLSQSAGREVHHPGPAELWALRVPMLVSDAAAVPLFTIALLNALLLAATVFWSFRIGGPWAAALASAMVLLSSGGSAPYVLVDPWNPFVAMPALWCFLAATIALFARRWWALPWALAAGTFAAQAHLSVAPIIAAVALGSAAVAAPRAWRLSHEHRLGTRLRAHRAPLLTSVVLGLVLWWPVVWDELAGSHNLRAIVGAGRGEGSSTGVVGLRAGWDKVADGVAFPPAFVEGYDLSARLHLSGALARSVLTLVLLLAAVAIAVRWRRRHPIVAAASFVSVLALGSGVFVMARLPQSLFQAFKGHNDLWLRPASALLWGTLLWAALVAVRERREATGAASRDDMSDGRVVLVRTVAVLAVPVVLALTASIRAMPIQPGPVVSAKQAAELLPGLVDRSGTYVVEGGNDLDGFSIAAALVLALEREGIDVRVPPDLAASFGTHRTRGAEGARTITVAMNDGDAVPPSPSSVELLTVPADPEALDELHRAEEALLADVRAAGGLDLRAPDEHLTVEAADRHIRDGSIRGLVFFGRVTAPELATADIDRLTRAREGAVRSVTVWLT